MQAEYSEWLFPELLWTNRFYNELFATSLTMNAKNSEASKCWHIDLYPAFQIITDIKTRKTIATTAFYMYEGNNKRKKKYTMHLFYIMSIRESEHWIVFLITQMGVSNEAKSVIPLKFLRKIKNIFFPSCR
jgi:hypothetical protein